MVINDKITKIEINKNRPLKKTNELQDNKMEYNTWGISGLNIRVTHFCRFVHSFEAVSC